MFHAIPDKSGPSAIALRRLGLLLLGGVLLSGSPVLAEAPQPPATSRLEFAAWAEQHGHRGRAEMIYRRILANDPSNDPAYQALMKLTRDRTPSKASTVLVDAQSRLPGRFATYVSDRFVVLSDADPGWTRAQMAHLERAFSQFQRLAEQLDLRPQPLKHKLVCILFADRREYQRFARTHDDVRDPWIAGYYSPGHDRVVFYRGESNPSVVEARSRLSQMEMDIASIARQANLAQRAGKLEHATALLQHEQRYREHVSRERHRVEEFAEQVNTATTVHETIHQLMFHTLVQSPRLQYPIWLSEGLATAFETGDTTEPFGPDHEYAPRRDAFENLLREDRLVPLADLITWTGVPANEETSIHGLYHQAYALVVWVCRYREAGLRTYLALLRDHDPEKSDSAALRRIFEQAFGRIDEFERDWLAWERARPSSTVPTLVQHTEDAPAD